MKFHGLKRETLVLLYRTMYLSRRMDDREILLKQQNKIFFQSSSAGHEAITATLGLLLRPGVDWIYPHYRDRALCLMLGVTPLDMLLAAVGSKDDPSCGGRQMPCHFGDPRLNIITKSSCIGVQFTQSIGAAEATLYYENHPRALTQAKAAPLGKYASHRSEEIVVALAGEGSTSEGEFWESVNAACLRKVPVLYVIEDNGYAISVPVEAQTAGGNISHLLHDFPGLYITECDGTDVFECYATCRKAVEYCRDQRGPALVHAHVTRPYSHSLSDDETLYKTKKEREDEKRRDPISKLSMFLLKEDILDEKQLRALETEVEREILEATDRALEGPLPALDSVQMNVYSPEVDPTSSAFETPARFQGAPLTMVEMISATISDEMAHDDRIVILGEDVADISRQETVLQVKEKCGAFKGTAELQEKHGSDRVFNSPLAEASIVGRSIGMATRGLKPVPEISSFNYIWPAMTQIRSELCLLRWRSNGSFKCPVVIRVPIGGGLIGKGIYQSRSGESIFTHCPGLRVVMPSTALDLAGLLRTSIRCDDPVLFLEHKDLYRQPYNRSEYPGSDFMIPFGKARLVREGNAMSIVTYGPMVHRAEVAAMQLEREGISIEIVDLRSLAPYDWEAIAVTVRKTHRVIVAHEDILGWGFGSEIAARIASELFFELDAPIKRVGAMDTFGVYQAKLGGVILQQNEDILAAVKQLLKY